MGLFKDQILLNSFFFFVLTLDVVVVVLLLLLLLLLVLLVLILILLLLLLKTSWRILLILASCAVMISGTDKRVPLGILSTGS